MIIRSLKTSIANPVLLVLAAALPISGIAAPELEYSYSNEWSVVSAPPPSGPYRLIHVDPRVPGQGITPPVTASFEPEIKQQAQDIAADVMATPPVADTDITADIPGGELPHPADEVIPQSAQDIATDVPASPWAPPAGSEPAASDTVLPPAITSAGQPPAPVRHEGMAPPLTGTQSVSPNARQSRVPGLYDRLMPPAAGDVDSPPTTAPVTRPPAPGQYGRMMPPRAPGFNYPGPNRQYGRQGAPGYMNMPPFGYYRGPTDRPEGEIPPPAVYQERPPYGGSRYPAP